MPGALMMAGADEAEPTAQWWPAGSAPMALSCGGFWVGMTCGVAVVVLSCQTPVPPVASTADPAANTPLSPLPPPAGTVVHAEPFHSAAYEDEHDPPSRGPREGSARPAK